MNLSKEHVELEAVRSFIRDRYAALVGNLGYALDRHEMTVLRELESAMARARALSGMKEARPPDGYAYRRYSPGRDGETYITFDGGGIVNGGMPIEAIPYWLGSEGVL